MCIRDSLKFARKMGERADELMTLAADLREQFDEIVELYALNETELSSNAGD